MYANDNGYQQLLSADDQLFLYESAGILIVASGAVPEKQLLYMKDLLSPIILKFDSLVTKLLSETDDVSSSAYAQHLYHLVAYASRASKAFPNQQALKGSGCAPCFTEALPIFLRALTIPIHRDTIHSGVRQYLHRMIVCLGEGVLPFIPVAVSHLLEDCTARDIQEFIPLINQIVTRFKHQIGPFLRDVFMAIVNRIFTVLGKPADEKDVQAAKEKETLRRSYFLFVAAVVTNDVIVVLTSQTPQDLHQVLLTLIQGGVECPDPVAQKISFNILRKLVELWGGSNGLNGFGEFIYDSIVPASFVAPMKSTFDLNDAQTILALQEIALTQKMILQKQGGELIDFLQNKYLPTLHLAPGLIQEYTQALQHADIKTFKNYVKEGKFSNADDLIEIWDQAHIYEAKASCRTAVQRYRLRQRFLPPRSICPSGVRKKKGRFSKETCNSLQAWLTERISDPYPDATERLMLAQQHGLTLHQVKNWFSNARRRLRNKPSKRPKNLRQKRAGWKPEKDVTPSVSQSEKALALSPSKTQPAEQPQSIDNTNIAPQVMWNTVYNYPGVNSVIGPPQFAPFFATSAPYQLPWLPNVTLFSALLPASLNPPGPIC
ncbi:hypothetical protein OS493_020041 [Desmophyllum pertusum]|uniref:Exportin-T n=1 Tax=Desmophyllum pertusum TaxID=174260 RepID=A0A9X0CFY2_9CNID|nr:hypothetical protein OS493_020041 [Desmophyllum pertusum]